MVGVQYMIRMVFHTTAIATCYTTWSVVENCNEGVSSKTRRTRGLKGGRTPHWRRRRGEQRDASKVGKDSISVYKDASNTFFYTRQTGWGNKKRKAGFDAYYFMHTPIYSTFNTLSMIENVEGRW